MEFASIQNISSIISMGLWNTTNTVSCRFHKFGDDQKNLVFQGDATSSSRGIELTKLDGGGKPVGGSVGRVLYSSPVHLWESSTVVASFETDFTFSISSDSTTPGDGLAFFIAPFDTKIPPNSGGSNLGLFPSDNVVAVEFDTYPNRDKGDPDYRHIGIDVNSIVSKATARWEWQNGKIATVHISYNSASKRLTVAAFYPGTQTVTLSHDIELNKVLPEWVRVGLSASTGQQKQTNTIHSWSLAFNNSIG